MEQEPQPENCVKPRAPRGAERKVSRLHREIMTIEAVSKPYHPLQNNQNARVAIMSLPRVRWLEREEV